MIGVEVREEVGDGEIAGMAECVDEEASVGDEFGVGNGGRWKWWEREGRWWELKGLASGEE